MESYSHLDNKHDLYWSLIQQGYVAKLEPSLSPTCRPDVLVEINGKNLAIEIQRYSLTSKEILKRMRHHTKAGAHTLWLIPLEVYENKRKRWLTKIQYLQMGVLFSLTSIAKIQPFRIDRYYNSKKQYIDYSEECIELNELCFEYNEEYKVNTTTIKDWWLDSYLDIYG